MSTEELIGLVNLAFEKGLKNFVGVVCEEDKSTYEAVFIANSLSYVIKPAYSSYFEIVYQYKVWNAR